MAATEDATGVAAKAGVETAGRARGAAIVGEGVGRTIHGGINDRKEIDPTNRNSIVIGSVAFSLDRVRYEGQPLTVLLPPGGPGPSPTPKPPKLLTATNRFVPHPPHAMDRHRAPCAR